ncbi:MAG: winged helix-turn-helix domain-containing protein, partial [Calditrichaeota bacterium]
TEGALSPKDFESDDQKKRNGWWDWKPAKLALELLFWQGRLMIAKRVNFQKYYDLTERVLPPEIETKLPTQKELSSFWIRQGLKVLGIATLNDLSKYYYHMDKKLLQNGLRTLIKENEIREINVESLSEIYYVFTKTLNKTDIKYQENTRAYILSPFDNFLINRSRIKKLFGFDYAIECYLPEAKRKFGYFSLPLLWKGDFAGLIEMKADRAENKLIIKNLVLEKNLRDDTVFYTKLSEEVHRFKVFNNCETISFGNRNLQLFKKLNPYL